MDITYGWWLPPDISTHGAGIDQVIDLVHWFMLVLFVGWGVFFAYCLWRFRERKGHTPSYQQPKAKPAKYFEVIIVVVEAVLLLGFSIPVWAQIKYELPADDTNPLHVRVVAEQFAWNFHYPGPDGEFGRTAPELMNAENLVGLDRTDPAAADDVVTNNDFRIVVDRPVIVNMTSKDVIHGFSIPVLRVKADVIPGMMVTAWFEATVQGEFEVACAQLCGNNHYTMKADLTVTTQDEFDAFIAYMSSGDDEEEEEEEE